MAWTIIFSRALFLIWHAMMTWMAHDGYSKECLACFHGLMTRGGFSMWAIYLVGCSLHLEMAWGQFCLEHSSSRGMFHVWEGFVVAFPWNVLLLAHV